MRVPVLAWAAFAHADGSFVAVSPQRKWLPQGPGVFHVPLGDARVASEKQLSAGSVEAVRERLRREVAKGRNGPATIEITLNEARLLVDSPCDVEAVAWREPDRSHWLVTNEIHDPASGLLAGCCAICQVTWPCAYIGPSEDQRPCGDVHPHRVPRCVLRVGHAGQCASGTGRKFDPPAPSEMPEVNDEEVASLIDPDLPEHTKAEIKARINAKSATPGEAMADICEVTLAYMDEKLSADEALKRIRNCVR